MKSIVLLAALVAAPALAVSPVTVKVEAPGVQNSTAAFTAVGVENFDSRATGTRGISTNFGGTTPFSGEYTNLRVNNADQYGGAGGTGRYAVQFGGQSYTLSLSSTASPINYFGFWLSALDGGNELSFYKGAQKVFDFLPANLLSFVGGDSAYYGNPNPNYAGRNTREPYAFVNFYFTDSIDRVVFHQSTSAGYESDNHTVGIFSNQGGGTVIPPVSGVPEPATWAMLILGFGMVGFAMRRRAALPAVTA